MASDPEKGNLFRRFKNKLSPSSDEETKEHLIKEIKALHECNEINDSEFSMLTAVLDFQSRMVREVMVPRIDAFMVDCGESFQDNLDEILREPYSRIPVYKKDKDKIVGVIHIRTVLRKAREKGFDKLDYADVMNPPLFAPETTDLSELLVEMQQSQQQLAILTDEYGGVVGLATIEDLIEEIVGNIDDEVDRAEVLFQQIASNKYVIYGKMSLDEFNEQFGTNLEMENVDTIAGFVITKLGIIPAKGEKLSVKLDNGMILTTRRMMRSRLATVLLTIPEKEVQKAKKEEEQSN
ncbi:MULTISPECIES: hemolysin family protein [unclassified Lactobacillus]|uniref:hemolysin family protein n=1 Tax=unclassified Lactobacillus TaxID=2620435 RepID=UPI000EFBA8CB|nr:MULTISPECIES: hemolysin family protein [unclassified Lactobacillus]RMC40743.1 HlyC/CorC family transporter [Lactobacillus sp. ESL0237]RMC44500.1 HlyC/CorC family transporter [Lactobacillus sp. ESL0234]RMC45807.1 HlyC/CorC family transporter [Lactobacillus sp. ESL0236]RMC46143.1 HlyC/CorC family transporter [Lactobacillus sp. ESL0230]RMC51196.1 HlyC/CorC family transporter [Lactobacillus sp. ESL0225]